MNKVSVVIPAYNIGEYLRECVNSLLMQTYQNIQIILVDDGSTDNTGMVCDSYSSYDNVDVIHKENQGVSKARNIGINHCTGEFVLFVDGDDIVSPDYVEKMVNSIESTHADIGICQYIKGEACPEKWKSSGLTKTVVSTNEIMESLISNELIGGYLWNKIFRKTIIQDNNICFADGLSIWEDMLFVGKYLNASSKAVTLSEELYFYRVRPGSALASESKKKKKDKVLASEMLQKLVCSDDSQFKKDIVQIRYNALLDYGWTYRKELSKEERINIVNGIKQLGIKAKATDIIRIALLIL